ncbi:MAG: Dabb family protein [Vicinamibacterales bacterium]
MKQLWKMVAYTVLAVCLVAVGVVRGKQPAGTEQTVMHVVAFTLHDGVTTPDLAALESASAELVRSVPGLKRAWVGKLRQPLALEGETRTHGLIFEFIDLPSRQAYSSHPARAVWAKVWDKVRKSGTNLDVIGKDE